MHRCWRLSGRLDELAGMAAQVEAFAAAARLSSELTGILNLVLEEWFVNLVHHGLGGQKAPWIEVRLALEGDRVVCWLRDNGIPFDPGDHRFPDLDVPLQERRAGSLGIYLIRSLVDSWDYRREGGCNLNRIEKRIVPS
ncbi:MAG TPA: ATP-binding protein [Methylothermaceae bacterium]|nr:ATP-binding protein [Methylothermaceae bacterium]